MGKGVLIIVDNLKVCQYINSFMLNETTSLSYALSVTEALGLLVTNDYSVVMIDYFLVKADGKLLRSAIDRLKCSPLIMILRRGYNNSVFGYMLNDSFMEMEDALRYNDRNYSCMMIPNYNFSMDIQYRRVHFNGMEIPLTRKEFDLLWKLSSNPGRVYTFEQLLDNTEIYVEAKNSVKCRIKRLRKKLNSVGIFGCIESVRDVGYRFKSLTIAL